MSNNWRVALLRFCHSLFAVYFILCLTYLLYSAIVLVIDKWLIIAVLSLTIEGFIVFILNQGDCPLIHVQKRLGDNTPFFELFFPPRLAKLAIPLFSILTILGIFILVLRLIVT